MKKNVYISNQLDPSIPKPRRIYYSEENLRYNTIFQNRNVSIHLSIHIFHITQPNTSLLQKQGSDSAENYDSADTSLGTRADGRRARRSGLSAVAVASLRGGSPGVGVGGQRASAGRNSRNRHNGLGRLAGGNLSRNFGLGDGADGRIQRDSLGGGVRASRAVSHSRSTLRDGVNLSRVHNRGSPSSRGGRCNGSRVAPAGGALGGRQSSRSGSNLGVGVAVSLGVLGVVRVSRCLLSLGRLGGRVCRVVSRRSGLGGVRWWVHTSGKRRIVGRSLEEGHFFIAAASEAGKNLSTRLVPLGKLLGGDSVGVLASVETFDELGRLDVAAANVESPADECAVLVGIEDNFVVGVLVDAVLGNLGIVSQGNYQQGKG